jgi:hypothetical protein
MGLSCPASPSYGSFEEWEDLGEEGEKKERGMYVSK